MGASGSGTSTLARGLANAFDSQAFDTDDFYWKPTIRPSPTSAPWRSGSR
jgi:adenylate kinase family enzyme